MARKKDRNVAVSAEDNAEMQQLLADFHELAGRLRKSSSEDEVKAALHAIDSMTESAQMALLKALSKERDVDAADILQGVYQFSPVKGVRKEARRSLIALEGSKIYPQWSWRTGSAPGISLSPRLFPEVPLEIDEEEEDDDEEQELQRNLRQNMPAEQVLENFLSNLVEGESDYAYEKLASDSDLRGGLSEDEWVELHNAWYPEADPQGYRTNFSRKLNPEQAAIDLPVSSSVEDEADSVTYEVGWSMSMKDTELDRSIRELPQPTAIYQVTQRHWFWTIYTLVKERGRWHVQSMTDVVAEARKLTAAELQERIQQHSAFLDEFVKLHTPLDIDDDSKDPDETIALEEARWRTGHVLAYYDALIELEPQALALMFYHKAAARSLVLNEFERSLVYLDLMLERFPENRAETLLQLGGIQLRYIQDLENRWDTFEYEQDMIGHIHELAVANLRESLALNDTYMGHMLLAELLKDGDSYLDEAEEQLRLAQALASDEATRTLVEREMGMIAMMREDYEQALDHYRRVAEVQPENPKSWTDIADAYNGMEQFEEAEANYRRAIEMKPDDINLYLELGTMYLANSENDKSRALWEEGLRANPDSVDFRYHLALILAEQGDFQRAQTLLEEAQEVDPDSGMANLIDVMLNAFKTRKLPAIKPEALAPFASVPAPESKQLTGAKLPSKFSRKKTHKRKKK